VATFQRRHVADDLDRGADVTDAADDQDAYATAERLLGFPLVPSLGPGEPEVGADLMRLGMEHTFGGVWQRLDSICVAAR
jgi:hypothetical protein